MGLLTFTRYLTVDNKVPETGWWRRPILLNVMKSKYPAPPTGLIPPSSSASFSPDFPGLLLPLAIYISRNLFPVCSYEQYFIYWSLQYGICDTFHKVKKSLTHISQLLSLVTSNSTSSLDFCGFSFLLFFYFLHSTLDIWI